MKSGKELEQFVQYIYQKLHYYGNIKTALVKHDVLLRGRSNCRHQIDVYWEYEYAGKQERVAIECKDYKKSVSIGKVRDFYGVLHDLKNVHGIMVSTKGFQSGAKQFAKHYGIDLIQLRKPVQEDGCGSVTWESEYSSWARTFIIDEEWLNNNHIIIENFAQDISLVSHSIKENNSSAVYFKMRLKNLFLYDSYGNKVSSIDILMDSMPDNPKPGESFHYSVENAWVELYCGRLVKIREVKFDYLENQQELKIAGYATELVEAILDNITNGEQEIVPYN